MRIDQAVKHPSVLQGDVREFVRIEEVVQIVDALHQGLMHPLCQGLSSELLSFEHVIQEAVSCIDLKPQLFQSFDFLL